MSKQELQDKLDQLEGKMTQVLETLQEVAEVTDALSKLAPTAAERKYVQKKIKQHEESLIDLPYVKHKCGRCGKGS